MKTKDLIIDEGGEGKIVEEIGEVFPNVRVAVLAKTFIIEAINLGDLTRFVIATKDGDALGISYLQSHKESNSLNGIIAAIDIIAFEQDTLVEVKVT